MKLSQITDNFFAKKTYILLNSAKMGLGAEATSGVRNAFDKHAFLERERDRKKKRKKEKKEILFILMRCVLYLTLTKWCQKLRKGCISYLNLVLD